MFRFEPREQAVLKSIVEKGYVALDGASLTVTAVHDGDATSGEKGWFEVMLIAYTQEKIITAAKEKGEDVNLEVDMVGKYVEKSVASILGGTGSNAALEGIVNRLIDAKMQGR